MRLISCHIENFGKLSNTDINFDKGYNEYIEKNGWGKSTFAAFIQAMFYGLYSKGKDIAKNERQKYTPWQGGLFGGKIQFEINGKEYILTRYFEKKEKDDVFELRDARTNLISKDFSTSIGEEIFKINKEAFCKTIFISQNDCTTIANDSITAKIGNLSSNTDDVNNYEKAMNFFIKYLNVQSPTRKTGNLYKTEQQIAELRQLVKDEPVISSVISDLTHKKEKLIGEREELKIAQKKLQDRLDTISRHKDLLVKIEQHKYLESAVLSQNAKVEMLKGEFRGGLPSTGMIEKYINENAKAFLLKEKYEASKLSEQEEKQLQELELFFSALTPEEQAISLSTQISELDKCNIVLAEKMLSDKETYRLVELKSKFSDIHLDIEDIDNCILLWEDINRKKTSLMRKELSVAAIKEANDSFPQKDKRYHSGIVCAGIMSLIVGLIISVFFFVPGIVTSAIGLVAMIAGFVIKRSSHLIEENNDGNNLEKTMQPRFEAEKQEIEEMEKVLKEYLDIYHIPYNEENISKDLHQTKYEAKEYIELLTKEQELLSCDALSEKKKIEDGILFILNKTNKSSQYEEANIRFAVQEYEQKKRLHKELQDKFSLYKESKQEYDMIILHTGLYLKSYEIELQEDLAQQLRTIKDKLLILELQEQELLKRNCKFEEFKSKVDTREFRNITVDDADMERVTAELKSISDRMENIHQNIVAYNKQLDDTMEKHDEIQELKQKLDILENTKNSGETKYRLVESAMSCMEKAKQTMTSNYTKPLLDEFKRLYAIVTDDKSKEFYMDTDTRVTVEECGMQRDIEYFSAGYQDLYGLCLRLAFIKAMFNDEVPFIVLDDTFVNLDNDKLKKAVDLLNTLSTEYQILYFTCHESRTRKV